MESFTEEELKNAYRTLGIGADLSAVIAQAKHAQRQKRRVSAKPIAVRDEDTITLDELRRALRSTFTHETDDMRADDFAGKIISMVNAHRENIIPDRTYRDANGNYYKKSTFNDGFLSFGTAATVPFSNPRRPLELMP
jgi:hypothetical protein